jgi:hypothetical protein
MAADPDDDLMRLIRAMPLQSQETLMRLAVEAGASIEADGLHFAEGHAMRFVELLKRECLYNFEPQGKGS